VGRTMGEYLAVNIFITEPLQGRNATGDFSFYKYFNLFAKVKNSYIMLGMCATYN
jgi:hypothetical protein